MSSIEDIIDIVCAATLAAATLTAATLAAATLAAANPRPPPTPALAAATLASVARVRGGSRLTLPVLLLPGRLTLTSVCWNPYCF